MDFVLYNKDKTKFLVIDAKYKVIDLEMWIKSVEGKEEIQATSKDTNISQEDLYQVFTYSEIIKTKFKENNPNVEIALFYPQNSKFFVERLEDIVHFNYFNNTKISFIPINLMKDKEKTIIESNQIMKNFIDDFLKETKVSENDTGG